jgi:hypothetical protein
LKTPKSSTSTGPARDQQGGSGLAEGSQTITGRPVGPTASTRSEDDRRSGKRPSGPRLNDRDDADEARRVATPSSFKHSARPSVDADTSPRERRDRTRQVASARAALSTGALGGVVWTHNNSRMRVVNAGDEVRVIYEQPRSGLAGLGITPGTPLFEGKKTGPATYAGQATTFSRACGPARFPVAGELSGDGRRLMLRGEKPMRGGSCQVTGYSSETLSFELAN